MNAFFEKPWYALGLLVFYLAIVSFTQLGNWGVIESSEARYAEISREMEASGDFIHPTLLGIKHYHKPPVTYWVTVVGYKIFGVNGFGVRFFLVISYLCQVVLLYFIARKIFSSHYSGLVAAVLYSSLPIVLVSMRGLTTDSYLMTCVLSAIWFWVQWKFTGRPVWLYLIAVAMGIGFLTKGPVVFIVPVLVMLGVTPGQATQTSFRVHHVFATLLFLVIAFSWFVVLVAEDRTFIDYFLFKHTVERYTNANVFKRVEPWWYYLAFAPLLCLPWVLALFFRIREAAENAEGRRVKRILLFWVIIPFVFFSFSSSKLVLYVLPLYSGVVLACTYWLSNFSVKQFSTLEKIVLGFAVLVGLGLGIYVNADRQLNIPLALKLIPFLFVAAVVALRQLLRMQVPYKLMLYSLFLTGFLLLYSANLFTYNELKFNSTRPIAAWLKENKLETRAVLAYNRMLPSLSFHLQKPIISLHDGSHTLNRETLFEKTDAWKEELYYLEDAAERERLSKLLQQPTVLIVKNDLNESSAWIAKHFTRTHSLGQWKIFYNE